jgi:hypothetical protein
MTHWMVSLADLTVYFCLLQSVEGPMVPVEAVMDVIMFADLSPAALAQAAAELDSGRLPSGANGIAPQALLQGRCLQYLTGHHTDEKWRTRSTTSLLCSFRFHCPMPLLVGKRPCCSDTDLSRYHTATCAQCQPLVSASLLLLLPAGCAPLQHVVSIPADGQGFSIANSLS